MCALPAEHIWHEAFQEKPRPQLYADGDLDEDGFKPLTDPQDFITNITNLTQLQLYAIADNSAIALKTAQDEYLELTREIAAIKGRGENTKNPHALEQPHVFEDKKEAVLYGYTYQQPKPALLQNLIPLARSGDDLSEQEKRDVCMNPEPFFQGGFVPNDRQYKGMLNRAKSAHNIDGWEPVERNGKFWIPVQQQHHDEYTAAYTRRNIDANGEVIRPVTPDSEDSQLTPNRNGLVNKRLTRTRFGGKKVPPTRDASEAPSLPSTPGKKRPATPALTDTREGTPKRAKVEPLPAQPPSKPKHPNQYTKAREREQAAQQAARAAAGGALAPLPTMPDFASMTVEEKLNRKWTDDELRASINADHTWLNPDPTKAAEWRDKILHGVNPVRSWSMVKKWSQWKQDGQDKRPRKKNAILNGNGDGNGTTSGSRPSTPAHMPTADQTPPVQAHLYSSYDSPYHGDEGAREESEGMVVVNGEMEDRSQTGTPGDMRRPGLGRRNTRNRLS